MRRFRRTVYVLFHLHDGRFLDVAALLRGEARASPLRQVIALPILTGEHVPIEIGELERLFRLPGDRFADPAEAGIGAERAEELAAAGVLVADERDGPLGELRRRDELLSGRQWNLHAALYHFMTRWRGVDVSAGPEGRPVEIAPPSSPGVRELVERFGPAPPAFHALEAPLRELELPLVRRETPLHELLRRRRTTRGFDPVAALTLEQLSLLLAEVFGAHGYAPFAEGAIGLHKTSPSGGGLHPTEAYPVVARVEGVEPGLYHYRAADHALELIEPLGRGEAAPLLSRFAAGQAYFGEAAVGFVLAPRFYRSFWKYRRHQKAYAALLMDAAHLSQTLYLVCAELGLGAFVTVAINAAEIDERLGLDGYSEGAIAVCGCGVPAAGGSPLEPEFLPYVPRRTRL